MGSKMVGSGPQAPGLPRVGAATARSWAMAAAAAAVRVPAANAEAAAWTVRGWADVAVGCFALDGPAAFGGLDEVIRSVPVASGGMHAARLRSLRRSAGPVPAWYPDARPVKGAVRDVGSYPWRAAALIAQFGESLMTAAAGLPPGPPGPASSDGQLAWGAGYRPLPSDGHVTVRLPVSRRLARRTWMCLPGLPAPGTAVAEVPSTATPLAQQIWRGIHEGAHLDHLAALSRPDVLQGSGPAAPSPAEFGAGLLVAESYAMAVEILAAVECILAGEGLAVWQLGAGLVERATRLPGGTDPAAEFADLPTLAEVYVLGPLELLVRATAGEALPLPGEITGSLRSRWLAASAAYPPAAAFGLAAAGLISGRGYGTGS
ncbi:MAG TPA: hypothetical protein VME19_20940 [Streptosporangiaceae bacterium]|nr:hypothetical protein [Streptosporangiaceae bacterium]